MAIPATDPYLTVCWPHPRTMYGQDFGERLSREVGMTIRALLVGSIVEEACDIGVAIGRLDLEREGVIQGLRFNVHTLFTHLVLTPLPGGVYMY